MSLLEKIQKLELRIGTKSNPAQQFKKYKSEHPRTKKTVQDFVQGHCGTYALAMHDMSKGKLQLGMLRGQRTRDGEDEDVNVHSFVLHPEKKEHLLDVEGTKKINDVDSEWKSSHDYDDEDVKDSLDTDIQTFDNRNDYLKALKETGHPDIVQEDYDDAVEHIKKHHKEHIK